MKNNYKVSLLFLLCCVLSGCANQAYFSQVSHTPPISLTALDSSLKQLDSITQRLGSTELSETQRNTYISDYNTRLLQLLKAYTEDAQRWPTSITVEIQGEPILLQDLRWVEDIEPHSPRIAPSTFGELGVAAVIKYDNEGHLVDEHYPSEGIFRPVNVLLEQVKFEATGITVVLQVRLVAQHTTILFGDNAYALAYSPSGAFLHLIQSATIDQYSFTGFRRAEQAETRRGVFSVTQYSATKQPIVMVHGLNSDPLIWRYLTLAVLNHPELHSRYQIWHVNYPSGPPPFFNAMLIRRELRSLITKIESKGAQLSPQIQDAVIIGHSMGGIIAKTLSVNSGRALWNTTFNIAAEEINLNDANSVKDIFIFEPVFQHSQVFFIDTPHRGSAVAQSWIGRLGASIVSLPYQFTGIFEELIAQYGKAIITPSMLPFLQNYGPNSLQVLRPGHPLMQTLLTLPVQGEAYSIIGDQDAKQAFIVNDNVSFTYSDINDGAVDFDSAYIRAANDTLIVPSNHDSYASPDAIAFMITRLLEE